MRDIEKWIWLPEDIYPKYQKTKYSGFIDGQNESYAVAEFLRKYEFEKEIAEVKLRFSGDTEFRLYCNNKFTATGPAGAGGDFLYNNQARPQHYSTVVTISEKTNTLDFFARVKLMPVCINEYSKGHGGFMLTAYILFADGTRTVVCTDKTWQCRVDKGFIKPYCYDGTVKQDLLCNALQIQNIWNTEDSPIPPRSESVIYPVKKSIIEISAYESKNEKVYFDKIYAGFIFLSVKAKGRLSITVNCFETNEIFSTEEFVFDKDCEYIGLQLHSVGGYEIIIKNESEHNALLEAKLTATHYPVFEYAKTETSDKELNAVLNVCSHTLKYCRQMMHLDSPKHSEPLACTGDYYIESLMTAFSFGDMRLAEFDIKRTAELLRYNNGRMFHTAYSLIWVLMLYDTYMFTGNKQLLEDCAEALILLLERFKSYMGANGLIENPPDYMFIDWLYIDGISLHHPPKALGQTCLNLFYYGALKTAASVFDIMSETGMSSALLNRAQKLKTAINTQLYDKEKGLYFEGLNTPTSNELIGEYMPQNTEKRYYRMHANILAAYFNICSKQMSQQILRKILSDKSFGDCQPYFAHFLLEAVYKNDLREMYTLNILERWKKPVAECNKGLAEGFITPEPSYSFDHSHAWGGTPLYSLPKALMGFEMSEAGFKKISIKPSLLGLQYASTEICTPFGKLIVKMEQGKEPEVIAPSGIEVIMRR